MTLSTVAGPGNEGLFIELERVRLVAHAALSAGDVVAVDLATVDSTTGRLDTTKQPTNVETDIFVVADEDVASGATGWFVLRGIVDAQTTGTPAKGAVLSGNTGTGLDVGAIAQDEKAIAVALRAGTTVPTSVMFDGMGLGHKSSA